MLTIAADPKHLGAHIGITSVLHTWGSALTHHPHVHMIVPGGGIALDGKRWVSCRPGLFLLAGSPLAAVALAQLSNHPSRSSKKSSSVHPESLLRVSRLAVRQCAGSSCLRSAQRPRQSNPHSARGTAQLHRPRFPPLEVFRRRPRGMSPRHHGPASENLHKSGPQS